jgi:PAS domain S-box-containing protein
MELQRREAIYSRVAERVVGMVCETDRQGIITFVSDSQRRILGFAPESIIGKKLGSLVHPQFLGLLDERLGRIRQTHSSELMEVQIKNANGQYLWVELVSDPVEDEEKHILSFVIAIRDITSTKKKIERLQNQVNDLEGRVKDRTEKIRALNETSNQRLRTAIRQINQISEVKDRLSKNPGLKPGFTLILKSAMRALASDAGGIFVLNSSEQGIEARAMIPGKNSTVRPNYQLNDHFPEFETFYRKDPFSKLETSGRGLLGTDTIHCAPILLANRVRGLLALGSNGRRVLDESGLTILRLYSGVAADLLRSTSLDVEPAKETVKPVEAGCRLNSGNAYLIPDNVDLAYELFLEAIMSGIEGLCITRTMPARLREKYNLQRTPIIWLTDEVVEGENTIHSLQDLSILISNYVQRATKPVILIDGIEYLISHKGFGSVYHLLQSKRTQMEANQGILIVPIFRDAMEAKESKLLEREFRVFGAMRDVYSQNDAMSTQIANEFY